MRRSTRAAIVLAGMFAVIVGPAGCAAFGPALASFFGAAAPVAVAAIDAYQAHAQAIAPGLPADSPLILALARALALDSECRVAVLAIPIPDAGPVAPSDAALIAEALAASTAAAHELALAIAAARSAVPPPLPSSVLPSADAGAGEGGA